MARNRAAQRDASEPLVVNTLVSYGCSVRKLSSDDEGGVPDLLCATPPTWGPRVVFLVEVKTKKTPRASVTLRPEQAEFFKEFEGAPVFVAYDMQSTLAILTVMKGRAYAPK